MVIVGCGVPSLRSHIVGPMPDGMGCSMISINDPHFIFGLINEPSGLRTFRKMNPRNNATNVRINEPSE